jgi:YVTN family beta-propeller protein
MAHVLRMLRRTLVVAAFLSGASEATAQPFIYAAPLQQSQPRVVVINGATLNEVAHIDLPSNASDVALGFEDRRLYVATGAGLVAIDTLSNTIVQTLSFPQGARAVTVSHDGQRIYVGRDPSTVSIVRATDFAIVGEIPVGITPVDVALTPDASALYVVNTGSDNVSVIDLTTFVPTTLAVGTRPVHVAVSPDGTRAYVANLASSSLSAIDTGSRTVVETIAIAPWTPSHLTARPSALGFSPDGTKLYVGDTVRGANGEPAPVRVMNAATRTFTVTNLFTRAHDVAIDGAAMRAYFFAASGSTFDISRVETLSTTDDTAGSSLKTLDAFGGGSIAVGRPAGCAFEINPKLGLFGPPGGSGTISVPAPSGCSWTAVASVPWITVSPTSGSGFATVTYSVGANSGEPRSATVTIAGQPVLVRQTVPQMTIDDPVNGVTLDQPMTLSGWAIDRDDTAVADRFPTGIDAIQVYAYPASGAAPLFLGNASAQTRADISNIYGAKYVSAGFRFTVRGLAAGTYTFVVYARSARTGVFDARTVTVTLRSASTPIGFVEAPGDGNEVTQPFLLAGWAADLNHGSGTGVDAVNVYAYPQAGGAPIFVGAATYGAWPRPDVANYFNDAALTPSGFIMLVSGLSIGRYTIVAYAHSTVTGEFFARTTTINVIGSSEAIMQVDFVGLQNSNPCCNVTMLGWAVDRRATTGNGISALHFWAYPDNGAPVFLGSTGSPTIDRDVPRLLMGDQFARSGWSFTSPPLASGGYGIVVYALSSVTGQFDAVRVVRVIVP